MKLSTGIKTIDLPMPPSSQIGSSIPNTPAGQSVMLNSSTQARAWGSYQLTDVGDQFSYDLSCH